MAIALNTSVGLHSSEEELPEGSNMQRRLFTFEEANALIPWLQRTIDRLNSSREQLEALQGRLTEIQRQRQRQNGTFQLHDEIRRMQAEIDRMGNDVRSIVDSIIEEGIIVRDVSQGLVDFPHMRDGREVYLCWIGGEESIGFWHETDRGFMHRQPL